MKSNYQQPSIADVAEQAGVSTATVSRVLSGHPHVSDSLREKVNGVARALGYRPNRVARNLRTQRTQLIGLIVSDIQNPFYTSMVRAVEDVAYQQQYSLLLCNSDEDPEKEQFYIEFMRDERVAGVIASPTSEATTSMQALHEAGIPVVAIDRRSSSTPVDTVMLDHEKAALELTQHLISFGHQRIGAIVGNMQTTSGAERMKGYLSAMRGAGLTPDPELIRQIKPNEKEGYQAALSLLSQAAPPTALFTGNNLISMGALKAIQAKQLRIPDEISIAGHDDLPWMTLIQPALTVAAQPIYEMGRQATELLMSRIQGDVEPVREVRLQPTMMIRQSCGPAPERRNGVHKG